MAMQVLHECDVLSIFLPGSEIPSCFSLQSVGSSISFDVPPLVGHKICGLNLCTVYTSHPELGKYDCAVISNKTKRVRWNYAPICYAVPEEEDIEKDMLWLSHWKIGDQLEAGDRIDVSVALFQHVKKCGICLVYEPEDKGIQSNTEEIVPSAFPWYQTVTLTKDAYFRCHHSFAVIEYMGFGLNLKRKPQLELDTCIVCEMVERDCFISL